jgi:hypothetical protein
MYPVAMLLLLLLTGITVLTVVQNTLELLIGIKALPLSTRVSTHLVYCQKKHLICVLFAEIYIRKHVTIEVGVIRRRPRSAYHILFRCNIICWPVHDAIYAKNTS